MADTDLLFSGSLDTTKPVGLVFGAAEGTGHDANVTMSATLPAPVSDIVAVHIWRVSMSATLPAPSGALATFTDNAVFRGIEGAAGSPWQEADATPRASGVPSRSAADTPSAKATTWSVADDMEAAPTVATQSAAPAPADAVGGWGNATAAGASCREWHGDLARYHQSRVAPFANATRLGGIRDAGWQDRLRRPRPQEQSAWGNASRLLTQRQGRNNAGVYFDHIRRGDWTEGIKPPPGLWLIPVTPPVDPESYEPPPGGAVHLVFGDVLDWSTDLLFAYSRDSENKATAIIPVRRAYIVLNEVSLKRVDNNLSLPVETLSLSIDADSWTWGFTATLPARAMADIAPTGYGEPVELLASINGHDYRLLAEGVSRSRAFAQDKISVTGRGRSAWLAAPYAPTISTFNTETRTAQQLMQDALTTNGATLGWSLDWQITDWSVPAGVWSHTGSYMSACSVIAEAAGGYIQPHPTAQILRVLPRYPFAPWNLASATIDVEIPSAIAQSDNWQWSDTPNYNAVYVSGAAAGILGHVVRAGSAGDIAAPMVVDPLITHADAARQRGLAVLANTGRGATVSLQMPVLNATGIITPGNVIRYVDGSTPHVGIVRSVSVEHTFPTLRQTLGVELRA